MSYTSVEEVFANSSKQLDSERVNACETRYIKINVYIHI